MQTTRRIFNTLVAAYGGAWIGALLIAGINAVRDDTLTRGGAAVWVILLTTLGAGAIVGWAGSRDLGPWTPQEIRDGALGWGIVAAIGLGAPSLFIPQPWGLIVAGLVLAAIVTAVVAVRRRAAAQLA